MAFTEVLARFGYRHEAELARGFLDDAGIESALFVDDAGGNLGLTLENEALLLVRADDAERARGVLQEAGMIGDEG